MLFILVEEVAVLLTEMENLPLRGDRVILHGRCYRLAQPGQQGLLHGSWDLLDLHCRNCLILKQDLLGFFAFLFHLLLLFFIFDTDLWKRAAYAERFFLAVIGLDHLDNALLLCDPSSLSQICRSFFLVWRCGQVDNILWSFNVKLRHKSCFHKVFILEVIIFNLLNLIVLFVFVDLHLHLNSIKAVSQINNYFNYLR